MVTLTASIVALNTELPAALTEAGGKLIDDPEDYNEQLQWWHSALLQIGNAGEQQLGLILDRAHWMAKRSI